MMNYTDATNKLDEYAREVAETFNEDDKEAVKLFNDLVSVRNCLTACRNELCIRCNRYKLDDCGKCRWGM